MTNWNKLSRGFLVFYKRVLKTFLVSKMFQKRKRTKMTTEKLRQLILNSETDNIELNSTTENIKLIRIFLNKNDLNLITFFTIFFISTDQEIIDELKQFVIKKQLYPHQFQNEHDFNIKLAELEKEANKEITMLKIIEIDKLRQLSLF